MSRGAGEVAGTDGGPNRRVLLKVTVEVSKDTSETILVREGDSARALAERFCESHRLQANLIGPLTAHIEDNIQRSEQESGRGVSAQPRVAGEPRSAAEPRAHGSMPAAAPLGTPGHGASGSGAVAMGSAGARSGTQRGAVAATAAATRHPRTPPREATPTGRRPGLPTPASASLMPGAEAAEMSAGSRTPSATPSHTPRHHGANGSADEASGSSRFERLHQDASRRRFRLERLRQQLERDMQEQQTRATAQVAPGTLRCAAWHRCPDECGVLGSRLYRDAAQRQLKLQHMQAQQALQQRQEEEQAATFHPAIGASQRSCSGVGRSMRDPDGRTTKTKIERLREMRDRGLMDGCTFKPEIDHKSEELMTQRIARMKITGSLYEALYEDALRRRERQFDAAKTLPPGVTFQPDIGLDHYRPSNDDTKEDFVNRLAYSKSYSERWLSMRKQSQEQQHQQKSGVSQDSRSQPEFHPQTGRGPIVERNKEHLPIGEFLYESGREKAMQSQAQAEEWERSQLSTPRIGEGSRQLFEETKRRKYRDLYEALVYRDPEQKLRSATLALEGLDSEMVEFLRPMIAYLRETGAALEFEAFCGALDYQRQHSVTPTAHLFIQKNSTRTSERYRRACDDEDFIPRTDRRSSQLAARHRPPGLPLHEQLFRERDTRESKLHEQRILQEQRQLMECTFQPNSSRPRSAGPGGRRRTPREAHQRRDGSCPPSQLWAAASPVPVGGRTEARPGGACGVAAVAPKSYRTPRRDGGLPVALIDHLSAQGLQDSGSAPCKVVPSALQASAPTAEQDVVVGSLVLSEDTLLGACRAQIDQAEQAVAQC